MKAFVSSQLATSQAELFSARAGLIARRSSTAFATLALNRMPAYNNR